MKSPRFLITLLFVVVLSSLSAPAQITLQGGVGVGLAVPSGDYGGSTIDYYRGTRYGLSTGINAHARARVGALGIRLMGEVGYSRLSNSGESEPGQGKVEVKHTILSAKLGPEYSFSLPFAPFSVYLGGQVGINIVGGESTFQGVSKLPSGTFDIPSETRVGLGGTVGLLFSLGPGMNLDVAARYDAINLLGKSWNDPDPLDDARLDSYRSINDERDPLFRAGDDKHFIANSRSISAVHLLVTLMFGL
jgi:opacity protein-like surface antigen